jgi:2-polyprenyl-6-methoxyphenol hydroxylase-like FAD-dependent oxidoreductase
MVEFAASLAGHEVAEVVRTATPLTDPAKMRYPRSSRWHYEKLNRYLDGFLVVGDALCNFNPIYGQGMTVAVLEAELLGQLIAGGGLDALPRRFFRAAAKLLTDPWALATGADLRFPQIEGRRRPVDRLLNRYLDRFRAATSVDPALGTAFLKVAAMTAPPASLLAPRLVARTYRTPAPAAVRRAESSRSV